MADRTSYTDTMTRDQIADQLRELAETFESSDPAVQVGNKSVYLSPPDSINYQIDVVERSSLLRGDHETIQIELGWKPE
ncbi:amphi-Trp domain-containing protein [Natronoarchaeum philippinense]|uniref:Amphi-Trp domain-containing protein n=1 Tax=Natronoarchaeum philippinense TaxID=558529 RepID=A0A285N622_NATPI|nr:amphi-Trp domain-containing protein [Natronoarchaeum philippinense]SNZ04758.1 amphi-Trp domain-containing protein [Natronoarchaeum philippinense]